MPSIWWHESAERGWLIKPTKHFYAATGESSKREYSYSNKEGGGML